MCPVKSRAWPRHRVVHLGLLALGLLAAVAGVVTYVRHSARETARLREQADKALDRQDLTAAAAFLRSYVDADPASADGYFLLAQTLRRDGKFDEAERALAEAKRLGCKAHLVSREAYLARFQRRGVREQTGA